MLIMCQRNSFVNFELYSLESPFAKSNYKV